MTTLTTVLIIAASIMAPVLVVSLYYNFKFGVLILKYVDQLEETLDVFDENYSRISEVTEMPVFYDSPQIRAVIQDIGNCRDSILKAANILGKVEEEEEEV